MIFSSSNSVNSLNKKDGQLSVTYNEYEKITEQLVSASGNTLTNQQVVKYYNNFNVEFEGETETIDLNVNVAAVKDEEGNEVKLTSSNYIVFMKSNDRSVRENAFKAMYNYYKSQKSVVAFTIHSSFA